MDKFALVTGATGGIGQAIVARLIGDGLTVIAHYNSNYAAALSLQKSFPDLITVQGDLSTTDGCHAFIGRLSAYPNISVLVNNLGVSESCLFTDMDDVNIVNMINTNLISALILTKHVIKRMITNRYGKIINISSIWGVYGGSCEVAYSASKGGIISFTKALSKELGLSNINVNAIAPGLIDTPMNARLSTTDINDFADSTSLGRIGAPTDIANLVSFLASEQSSYITGQIIGVDGGLY